MTPLAALLGLLLLRAVRGLELHQNLTGGLGFSPHQLHYRDGQVCIPTVSEFVIENGNSFDVHVTGVLSSAPQFLPLMFQPQVLAPGQSAIIQLLFLPYRVERVEATLTVSSSVGAVTYDVTGIAAPNPYRLFPVVGHRLTVGERLDQSIVVHNPFEDPLHVREVFTTEDFLSLRGEALGTDGGRSAASGVWEISPGAEVEVVQLSIACAEPGLHTGYVHVKTDRDSIVVPVEVEVSSRQVSSALSLDFGVVTSSSAAQLDLWLMNSGDSDLAVLEIVPSLSDHGLTIDLEPNAVLIAGISTKVAKVTYAGGQRGRASGTLLVTTNHSSPALAVIEIPYQASVMLGGIGFSRSSAVHLLEYRVLEGEESSASDFPLYNYYNAPVSLSSASVETCAGFVEMLSDLKALPVEDTESWHRLKLLVHRHDAVNTLRPLGRLPFTCWLDVGTNVSTHRIPLHLTDGCLRLHFFEEEVEEYEDDLEPGESLFAVQLEDLSTREPRPFEIALSNPNPMAVPLHLQWISPGHDLGVCVGPVWKTRVAASDLPNATPAAHAEARRQARVNSSALRCLEYVNDDDFLATIPAGHSLLLLFRMRYSEDDDCEDCPLSVRLATPFEVIELRVSYDSLEAGLMSAVEGGNATLVLGRHQDVVVSTASSFPYDLFLTDVAVAGSGYAVRVLAHLIPPSALLSEADDGSSALDTGVYSVAVAPLLLQCASDPPPLGSTVLLTCLRRMLSSVDPGMTQHQRVGKLVFSLEARLMSGQLSSAHSHLRLLRQAWSEAFPRGFPLPPIQLVLEAPQTMHSLVIENVSVVSPLELLPLRTVLELPVLRVEQCAVVAVTVRNPFLMPLSFSLAVEGWRPRVPGNKQLPQFHSSKDAVRIEGQPIYAEETSSADSVLAYRLQSGLTPSPLPTLSPRLQLVTGAQVLIDDSGFLRSIAGEQRPPFSLIAEQETVVGPGQSAVVGHVLFVPNTVGGEPLKDDFSSTIFVRNNFTGLDKSTEQLVRGQSFQMTITIRNAGSVAVGVANVLLDGMSIRSFWRNFWPNAVRVVAPFKSSIAPGEQWMLEASGVWDCAMREERHDVAVVPSGRRAAELSVRAHFLVRHKEESVAACNQRGGYSDVFVIAIAHLLILVALVLLISLLRRRAEQIQSKRAAKAPARNPSPPNTRLPEASSDDPDSGPLPLVETVMEPPSTTEEVHELPLSHGSSVDYDAELERDVSSSSELLAEEAILGVNGDMDYLLNHSTIETLKGLELSDSRPDRGLGLEDHCEERNGFMGDAAVVETNGSFRSPRQSAPLGPPPGIPVPQLTALDISFLESSQGWQGYKDEYSIFSHPSPFQHAAPPGEDASSVREQDSAFSIIDDLSWTRPHPDSGRRTSFGFENADDLGSSLFSEPFYGSSLSSGRENSVFSQRDTPSAWSQAISLSWSPLGADTHSLGSSFFNENNSENHLLGMRSREQDLGDSFFSNDGMFGYAGGHRSDEGNHEAEQKRRGSE